MPDPIPEQSAVFTELPNRGLLRLSGPDRVQFLQGLVSNDVGTVAPGRAVYACLLTPQGKFLHDFFLIADGETILIECEAACAPDLLRRLGGFRLRSKIALTDVTGDFDVFAGVAFAADGIVYLDPRLLGLGTRALLPKGEGRASASFDAYDRLRIALGVPDGSRDMTVEKSVLLENNIDVLNGISWDKGCYMGQELTARTRYRGLVKKRLVPVRIAGVAPDTGTVLIEDGHDVGEMRSSNGDLGLALLRLETIRQNRPVAAGGAVLTPEIPPHLMAVLAEPAEA